MKRRIRDILSRPNRTSATDGGSSGEVRPPKSLQRFVGGAFDEVGAEFFGYLVELCGLQPDDAVLDVGCRLGTHGTAPDRLSE